MTDLMTRRQLLRRGAALAGALLVSGPFVNAHAAAPSMDVMTAYLQVTSQIANNYGSYTFGFSVIVNNAGAELVTLQGVTVTAVISTPQSPHMAPMSLALMDTAMYSRAMPDITTDIVAGSETLLRTYDASFPPGFAPGTEWRGQMARVDATVLLGVSTGYHPIPCRPLEIQFPSA